MSEALVGSPPEKIYFSRSNSQNQYKTLCSQGIPVITKSLQKSIQESVLGALFIGIRFALKCPKSLRYFSRFRFRSIPLSQLSCDGAGRLALPKGRRKRAGWVGREVGEVEPGARGKVCVDCIRDLGLKERRGRCRVRQGRGWGMKGVPCHHSLDDRSSW